MPVVIWISKVVATLLVVIFIDGILKKSFALVRRTRTKTA